MWKFSNDKPVYIQIADELMLRIVSGVYKPGESIPAVSELAEEARVNPNTVQKALEELEKDGYVISLKTSGVFVTEDTELIGSFRDCRADEAIAAFIAEMERLGVAKDELPEKIRDYCGKENNI